MVTEILQKRCSFLATTVKFNSQNNCMKKSYKEKHVSLLVASRKDSIPVSQKNPVKCKALFPHWNLKTCKFYDVSVTEEQFDFPRKLIPVARRFLENPLVAVSDDHHNHILISKKCYQLPMNFRRKVHRANVLIQIKSAFLLPFLSDLFCVSFFVFHFF